MALAVLVAVSQHRPLLPAVWDIELSSMVDLPLIKEANDIIRYLPFSGGSP